MDLRRRLWQPRLVRIARLLVVALAPCFGAGLVSAACADDGPVCIEGVKLWADRGSDPVCIVGDLVVENRTADELGVLDRVESVTGSVLVHTCPELVTLPAWPLLKGIGGSLSISNNDSLVEVEGFPALEELGGNLYIAENPVLVSVRIGSGVTTVGSVFFALNPSWTDVDGLSSLTEIDGDVKVAGNAALEHLRLPALTRISGDLSLIDNPLLQSLDFPALEDVGSAISISENSALVTIAGFPALRAAGHAFINRNNGLRRIIVPPMLDLSGVLEIRGNGALEQITAPDSFRMDPSARLIIAENPVLEELTGFSGLESMGGLEIDGNAGLLRVSGFADLRRLQAYDLKITRNASLVGDASWFPELRSASALWVFGNPSLEPSIVDALLARVAVDGETRVGDNGGEFTALDPCPWPDDGVCDAEGPYGTELCVSDPEDCG